MTGAAADFVQAQVAGDGEQPGGKPGGHLVARGGFIDLDKDVLGEVLGFGGVPQKPVNQVHHRLFVFVHQFGKSGMIPAFNAQHEVGIGIWIGRHWYR